MSNLDNVISRLQKVRKPAKELPNVDYLRECFNLTDDGRLFWRERPSVHFGGWPGYSGWNKKYAGKCADVDMQNGYFAVCVNGVRYKSHRIVFAITHGCVDPVLQIDHVNGDPKDNRPVNLRQATQSQNTVNFKGARIDNSHGDRGVSWKKKNQKWEASCQVAGKRMYLGLFTDKQEAIKVSALKRVEVFGCFWSSQNAN